MIDVQEVDVSIKLWDGKYYVAEDVERSAPGLVAYVREHPEFLVDFVKQSGWYRRQLNRKLKVGIIGLAVIFLTILVCFPVGLMQKHHAISVATIVGIAGVVGICWWLLLKHSTAMRRIGIYDGRIHISRLTTRRTENIRRCVWQKVPDKIDEFQAHGAVYQFRSEEGFPFLLVDDTDGRLEQFLNLAGIRQYIKPNLAVTACIACAAGGAAYFFWNMIWLLFKHLGWLTTSVTIGIILNGLVSILFCSQLSGSAYHLSNRFVKRTSFRGQWKSGIKESAIKFPFLVAALMIFGFSPLDAAVVAVTLNLNASVIAYVLTRVSRNAAYRAHRRHRTEQMRLLRN